MKKIKSYLFFTESINIPDIIKHKITQIKVKYINFNGIVSEGIIECNIDVKNDLINIFDELLVLKFPICQINPISKFNNNDIDSVKGNNTSCFNYRYVIGTDKISDHATGNAIDINPMQNPWVHTSAHKIPGREYNTNNKGTITSEVVTIFSKYGWQWGGNWRNPDYQHFFKEDKLLKQNIIKNI